MTRIDAHHHVWDVDARVHSWLDGEKMAPVRRTFTLDGLAVEAAAAGIDRTVLVQVLPDMAETAELLALAAKPVRGVVGWVDLTAPGVADDLAALQALPEPGSGPAARRAARARPPLVRPARRAGRPRRRRPLRPGLRPAHAADQLPAAIRAVARRPRRPFVLDPPRRSRPSPRARSNRGRAAVKELAAYPNVYCKLSGMVTEADWASWPRSPTCARTRRTALAEVFGPERVMFGSDWPVVCSPPTTAGSPGPPTSCARA